MYAIVVTANIAPGQFESSRKALKEEVVPRVTKAPGMVKGYWTINSDHTQGVSIVVFQSRENAEEAVKMVRNTPPPTGVTLGNVELREVVAET